MAIEKNRLQKIITDFKKGESVASEKYRLEKSTKANECMFKPTGSLEPCPCCQRQDALATLGSILLKSRGKHLKLYSSQVSVPKAWRNVHRLEVVSDSVNGSVVLNAANVFPSASHTLTPQCLFDADSMSACSAQNKLS